MSDIAKWALLIAGAVALIAIICTLPFMNFMNASEFANAVNAVVSVAGGAFRTVRGILNNFLTPFGRTCLTGLIAYFFTKWIAITGIKITTWIYHFIFK